MNRVIAVLRLGRTALSQWARDADADGRPCCALTLARVREHLTALINYLLDNAPRGL